MCFAIIMQIIKRILNSSCLYMVVLFFIMSYAVYMMLAPVNDEHAINAINEKKKGRNNEWIYIDDDKEETVSPRNNFEDLQSRKLYMEIKVAFLATMPLMLLIMLCYYFGKIIIYERRINSATDRHNVVRYQNDRVSNDKKKNCIYK
ncbi:hypothetical protein ACFW04_002308 [Cataglyphis niger]